MTLQLHDLPPSLTLHADSLRACLEAFADALPVQEVYLFGSHARGDASADSDVDLCIVVAGADEQLAAARRLRRAIRDIRPKPRFTLVPISPQRLEEKRESRDPFFTTVLEEGIVLAS